MAKAVAQRDQCKLCARSLPRLAFSASRKRSPPSTAKAQGARQLTFHLFEFQLCSLRTGNDHYIRWGLDTFHVPPKKFPYQALHPVANNGSADLTTGSYTEPRRPFLPPQDQHDKCPPHPPLAVCLDTKKVLASPQAQRFREPLCLYPRCWLGCLGGMVTVSRLRPLARRRLSTARPPGLAIRARKP